MNQQFKNYLIKYRPFAWSAIIALGTLVILIFVVVPQLSGYIQSKKELEDVSSQTHRLEVKASTLDALDAEKIASDLQIAVGALPTDPQVPQSIVTVQNLVSSSGLELKGISYAAKGRDPGKSSFQLNIQVTGTKDQLKKFLGLIKQSPRLMTLESIGLERSGEDLVASIPLTVYYQPDLGTVAPSDTILELTDAEKKGLATLTASAAQFSAGAAAQASSSADVSTVPLGKSNPFN